MTTMTTDDLIRYVVAVVDDSPGFQGYSAVHVLKELAEWLAGDILDDDFNFLYLNSLKQLARLIESYTGSYETPDVLDRIDEILAEIDGEETLAD